MAKITIGICGICEDTRILDSVGGRTVATPAYTEISIALSNGTIAIHGVCNGCADKLTKQKVEAVLKRIQESWEEEMAGWAKEKDFKNMRALTAEAFDKDPLQAERKMKEGREKEHKKNLKALKDATKSSMIR